MSDNPTDKSDKDKPSGSDKDESIWGKTPEIPPIVPLGTKKEAAPKKAAGPSTKDRAPTETKKEVAPAPTETKKVVAPEIKKEVAPETKVSIAAKSTVGQVPPEEQKIDTSKIRSEFLLPDEPIRFTTEALDRLLVHCVNLQASDITLQTNAPVFAEIHGRIYPVTTRKISNTEVGDMLNAIYGSNGTTQIFSGKDVDTHYEVRPTRTQRFRFRVNGTGCQVEGHDGIQITIRTIPTTPPDISTLNLEPDIIKAMAPYQGTVVVTGPTGSGKSTLLASIIRSLAEQKDGNRKMLTYEAPIEFVYDMVQMPSSVMSQSEIPRHLPSFAAGVRNALRRKPRLILVGEARDPETISAVIDAALTGHPVYTTLHSNGVADAVRRMISTFPAEERHGRALDILETLRLVIWQHLAPSTDGKRVALREFLIFDEEVRDILVNTDVDQLAARTRILLKEKGQPMLVDAERKFKAGILPEREFRVMEARAKMLDKDVGVD